MDGTNLQKDLKEIGMIKIVESKKNIMGDNKDFFNKAMHKYSGEDIFIPNRKDSSWGKLETSCWKKDSDNISIDANPKNQLNIMHSNKSVKQSTKDLNDRREFILNKGLQSRRSMIEQKKVNIVEPGHLSYRFDDNIMAESNYMSKKSITSRSKIKTLDNKHKISSDSQKVIEPTYSRQLTDDSRRQEKTIGLHALNVESGIRVASSLESFSNLQKIIDTPEKVNLSHKISKLDMVKNTTNTMPSLTNQKFASQTLTVSDSRKTDLNLKNLKQKINSNRNPGKSMQISSRLSSHQSSSINVIKNLDLKLKTGKFLGKVPKTSKSRNIASNNHSILNYSEAGSQHNEVIPIRNKFMPSVGLFVPDKEKINIHRIFCSQFCTYYVTNLGIFSIGNKESGLLGFVNVALQLNYPVPIDLDPSIKIKGISCSNAQHVMVWDDLGRLFTWGSNRYGK